MNKIYLLTCLVTFYSATIIAGNPPKFDHVVIVIMENHPYSDIIGSSSAPYINALSDSGALFTQSYAITHPSQPNYLDMYAGYDQGVTDDKVPSGIPFSTANLGYSLINKSYTFKGYSEDLPSVGYKGASSAKYARKHAPWVNWQGSGTNQVPDSVGQPFSAFPTDYSTLPTVAIVVPNLDNDMHDGTITDGDNWVKHNLDSFIHWSKKHNSLLILTWDEDDNSAYNQIATVFYGAHVVKGKYKETINHFAILRTVIDMYSLTPMDGAATDSSIKDIWVNTGINEVSNHQRFNVNVSATSNNNFNIVFADNIPVGTINVSLTDMAGRELKHTTYASQKQYVFQTGSLPAGCYIINLETPSFLFKKKVILLN